MTAIWPPAVNYNSQILYFCDRGPLLIAHITAGDLKFIWFYIIAHGSRLNRSQWKSLQFFLCNKYIIFIFLNVFFKYNYRINNFGMTWKNMLSVDYTYRVTAGDHMAVDMLNNRFHNNIMYSSILSLFVQY